MSKLETEMTPDPGKAETIDAGQVPPTPAGFAMTTLVGSVSVKPMPVCAGLPAPLESVNIRTEVPPWSIVAGAKALFKLACLTARLAVFDTVPAASAIGPVTVTPDVAFGSAPLTVELVTGKVTVHELDAGIVRPLLASLV